MIRTCDQWTRGKLPNLLIHGDGLQFFEYHKYLHMYFRKNRQSQMIEFGKSEDFFYLFHDPRRSSTTHDREQACTKRGITKCSTSADDMW